MASRKKKKRKPKKSDHQIPLKRILLFRIIISLFLLTALVLAAGLFTHYFLRSTSSVKPAGSHPAPSEKPVFEIYPEKKTEPGTDTAPVKDPSQKPKLSLIVDDLGYDKSIANRFFSLDAVLTCSILPYSPFHKSIAQKAHEQGIEVMLHLPMEPVEYPGIDPGPGTLFCSMPPDQLIRQLEKNIEMVPFIKGVNNHMGSKMTASSTQMYQIFSVLKQRNLYFIDSRSTTHTVCRPSARLFQIPFAERTVFIDHQTDVPFIRSQIKVLLQEAHRQGEAIGIVHPHENTLIVLQETLPDIKEQVTLVPASRIVHLVL